MGLDLEMAIDEHYGEVLNVLDRLFVYIFSGLRAKFGARRARPVMPARRPPRFRGAPVPRPLEVSRLAGSLAAHAPMPPLASLSPGRVC